MEAVVSVLSVDSDNRSSFRSEERVRLISEDGVEELLGAEGGREGRGGGEGGSKK